MCMSSCGKLCTAFHILWSVVYVCAGAVQIIAGIFFVISFPALHLYSILVAGSWNVVMGISGGMLACFQHITPLRQELLLSLTLSILVVNTVNACITEYTFFVVDEWNVDPSSNLYMLLAYARAAVGACAAGVLMCAFLDSQLAFISIQTTARPMPKKVRSSHEQVSDIEYIIPRAKPASSQKTSNAAAYNNAYAQSWVFDSGAGCSNPPPPPESPYMKFAEVQQVVLANGHSHHRVTTAVLANPVVVHVEEASDTSPNSNSNSDRKIPNMKSFSRTPSPGAMSACSSQTSLNNPPIYECLERLTEPSVYRSRLNSALSVKGDEPKYAALQPSTPRLASPRPADKVQYASLMVELERALVQKKSQAASPEPTAKTFPKPASETEFSKELEAALQLIQDLESPSFPTSTPNQPRERPFPRRSADLASPANDTVPELYSFKAPKQGKGAPASATILCNESQSTSGYSSPTLKDMTQDWSAASSMNGSAADLGKPPMSYSIQTTKTATVITLYPHPETPPPRSRAVTVVNLTNGDASNSNSPARKPSRGSSLDSLQSVGLRKSNSSTGIGQWNVKSLLRKKKASVPKLPPELEGAIIKSESLAYLSEHELLARHERNREIHRQIEQRVQQQLVQQHHSVDSIC